MNFDLLEVFKVFHEQTKKMGIERMITTAFAAALYRISLDLDSLALSVITTIFLTFAIFSMLNDVFLKSRVRKLVKKFDKYLK